MANRKEFQQRARVIEELVRKVDGVSDPELRASTKELMQALVDHRGNGVSLTNVPPQSIIARTMVGLIPSEKIRDSLSRPLVVLHNLGTPGYQRNGRDSRDVGNERFQSKYFVIKHIQNILASNKPGAAEWFVSVITNPVSMKAYLKKGGLGEKNFIPASTGQDDWITVQRQVLGAYLDARRAQFEAVGNDYNTILSTQETLKLTATKLTQSLIKEWGKEPDPRRYPLGKKRMNSIVWIAVLTFFGYFGLDAQILSNATKSTNGQSYSILRVLTTTNRKPPLRAERSA